ncbi:MAG TPA: protein-methionine-sulfoxide reductase catalytic subunit MsrP, partial [Stellaceae bacterium]|nr:protein-methionine-sulfoxide reductase catalytic subunit MsrP [Stellaceae bacterium]
MLIGHRRGWELPERAATDETVFRDRRRLIQGLAAGPILAPALLRAGVAWADADPSAALYPAKRNPKYTLDRPLTPEKYPTNYNNFYEFGTDKDVAAAAQA